MQSNRWVAFTMSLALALGAGTAHADVASTVTAEVGARTRPDGSRRYVGVSVGVIKDGSFYQFHFGEAVLGSGDRPTPKTFYGIGSITKTFTATVLALYDHRGLVAVPAAVPPPVPIYQWVSKLRELTSYPIMPQWRDVTLEQLAMHHGRLPKNPPSGSGGGTYKLGSYQADFDALFDTLRVCPPGTSCDAPTPRSGASRYSNYGYELLGKVLADVHGSTVEDMLDDEVFSEIGMFDTATKLSLTDSSCVVGTCEYDDYGVCTYRLPCHRTFSARAAVGYQSDQTTRTSQQGSDSTIAIGAGSVWSTTDDMMDWLGYNMGHRYRWYRQEMLDLLPELHTARDGTYGLAWKTKHLSDGRRVISKGGDTSGFHAWMGWIDGEDTGVVVLFNSSYTEDDDDEDTDELGSPGELAMRLLETL